MTKIKSDLLLLFLIILPVYTLAGNPKLPAGEDTIRVKELRDIPDIDGIGDDPCWDQLAWNPIDQVWMPWGAKIDSVDFYGRFKIGWSPVENLLFVLLEVQDDVASDNYTPGNGLRIYNFDMFEVFIDEDRSGGLHVFDGADSIRAKLGSNAENAFGYHICTRFGKGDQEDKYYVEDISGSCWENMVTEDYRDHFSEFSFRREGTVTVWEFSLKVYDDTYSPENPEASRVQLSAGKIMGFSMAYNDDDDANENPADVVRDHFFGSVPVPEETWNDHWRNADAFGVAKLEKAK